MQYVSPLVLMILEHTSNGDMVWIQDKDNEDVFVCEDFCFHRYASPEGSPLWIEDADFCLRDLECELLRRVIDPDYNEKFTKNQLKPNWKYVKEVQNCNI